MQTKGNVAVVTGAGSGLGAALARRMAGAGMKVAVADIAADDAESVAEEIRGRDGAALALPLDAGDEASISALADQVEGTLGPCQILCANVGVQQFGRAEDLTRADWEWVYGVNVFGTVALVRTFLPQLRKSKDPRIAITASTSALYPCSHMSAYVSSKYALLGFAESLRLELAEEGIGVTAILPGPMATTHIVSSAAAKPSIDGHPVHTPETIEVIAKGAGGEMADADHAARNVLDDLAANRPYTITHHVHTEPIEARLAEIREAFEFSKR